MLGCDWRRNFFKNGDGFIVIATRLSRKTICSITIKQCNGRFMTLKRNIQNTAAGFALFTVVETSRFLGWNVNTLFFYMLDETHLRKSWCCPHTILSFYIWLIEWGLYWTIVCRVTSVFVKRKRVLSVFVVFTCSCNVKGTFWTNNQAPQFSTTINVYRSCYINTNRFAFPSVETVLARTINISKSDFSVSFTMTSYLLIRQKTELMKNWIKL